MEENISWKGVEDKIRASFKWHIPDEYKYHQEQSSYLEVPLKDDYIFPETIESLNQLCKDYGLIMSVRVSRKWLHPKATLFFWIDKEKHSKQG
jgi:hypothetical protein